MRICFGIYFFFFLFFIACKAENSSQSAKRELVYGSDTITSILIPSVLPLMLTDPDKQQEYLLSHYWDYVNFCDTNYIHHPEITERAWVSYCELLHQVPLTFAKKSLRTTMERAYVAKVVFNYFVDLADNYLYHPNSPVRSEELYISVLDAIIDAPILSDAEKERSRGRLKLVQRNRVGTKAYNFTYSLYSNQQSSLYELSSEYIVLFFNNPECYSCKETMNHLRSSVLINQMVSQKRLIILSVYPDEEVEEWMNQVSSYPNFWINGYDKQMEIREKQIYDLRAIPSLYLLDRNKIVLLKDVSSQHIEEFFENII